MNRFGVRKISDFKKIYKLAMLWGINIEGVFTHFSTAGVDEEIFCKQKIKFNNFLKEIPNNQLPIIHIGGSGVLIPNGKKTAFKMPEIDVDYNMVSLKIFAIADIFPFSNLIYMHNFALNAHNFFKPCNIFRR